MIVTMLFTTTIALLLICSVQCNHLSDNSNRNTGRNSAETPYTLPNWSLDNTIDYRLTRLEVEVRENSEKINSELRETNRRLQNLEWQNTEAHSILETLKAEMQRFTQQPHQSLHVQRDNHKLENRVDTLTKGVKIMIAAMRALNGDFTYIRNNITKLTNQTEHIFRANEELLTKQVFNTGLLELKTERPLQTCSSAETISLLPKNCLDIQLSQNQTGIYKIQPEYSIKPIMVLCDMETMGGGWVVIQNRNNGNQDFYLNWQDYKYGFGNLGGEFWLGLENIYALTGHDVNELLIELEDFNSQKAYAHYGVFSVGSGVEGYSLKVLGGYKGDAGDSLTYHAGSKFSTKDMDQDSWSEGGCAQAHGGGWWYKSCSTSNLNGKYLSGELPEPYIYQGMYWGEFRGAQYSLLKARMLVRVTDKTRYTVSTDTKPNISPKL